MQILNRKFSCFVLALIAVLFAVNAFGATPKLPDGLVMSEAFKPGYGASIGKFRTVQGKVVVMHADMKEGYWAKKGQPLYKGDIIVTQKKSRTNFVMNDKSIISLSSNTRLVLTKSIYDEKKKRRSSFLGLTLGKARFVVSKLLSFKRREFKVKTVTAVCGVRGSDFIIVASENYTEVTALDKTKLAIVSLADPGAPPVIVSDYQRTGVELGQLPYEAQIVPPEEIQELKKDVTIPSEETVTGEGQDVQQEDSSEDEGAAEEDAATEETGEEGTAEEDTATGETGEEEAAEEDAATEETGEDGSAEEDTATQDTREGETTEEDATTDEPRDSEAGAAEDPADSDTAADETQEGEIESAEPTTDNAGGGGDSVEDQDAGADVAATSKTVGVTTGTGDASPDVSADQDTPVDTGAVYVSDEALAEPEVPTEFDQPVVDIEDIVMDVVEQPEIADQVAEQILQEDLEIPEMPGTPE